MVVTENFEIIARTTIESLGSPGHPLVVLPADTEFAPPGVLRGAAARIVHDAFGG